MLTLKHGFFNINKPENIGSTDVVRHIKRIFKQFSDTPLKIGHAGTLDPFADGVLPIAIGEGTKAIAYMMDAKKSYRFTIFWGQETNTLDRDGDIIKENSNIPTLKSIINILPQFIGTISQMPPAFSALRIDGKRAYDLARAGKEVNLLPREISIETLKHITSIENLSTFEVTCSKGTYIRSLAKDIAYALNTVCYVKNLTRLRVGNFLLSDAITLDKLNMIGYKAIIPVHTVLEGIPDITLSYEQEQKIRFGQTIFLSKTIQTIDVADIGKNIIVLKNENNSDIIGFGEVNESVLKAKRLFNFTINQ